MSTVSALVLLTLLSSPKAQQENDEVSYGPFMSKKQARTLQTKLSALSDQLAPILRRLEKQAVNSEPPKLLQIQSLHQYATNSNGDVQDIIDFLAIYEAMLTKVPHENRMDKNWLGFVMLTGATNSRPLNFQAEAEGVKEDIDAGVFRAISKDAERILQVCKEAYSLILPRVKKLPTVTFKEYERNDLLANPVW